MSMINHSCSPNSINYVLGEAMVIRAAAPISLGDEVTISYLGKPQLQPVNLRIDELRENYSFTCECERCTAELIHMEKVSSSTAISNAQRIKLRSCLSHAFPTQCISPCLDFWSVRRVIQPCDNRAWQVTFLLLSDLIGIQFASLLLTTAFLHQGPCSCKLRK